MKTLMLALFGLLIAGAIAWFAAEQHYDNCITAAEARTPLGRAGLTAADKEELPGAWDQFLDPEEILERGERAEEVAAVLDRPRERRQDAIDGCSRLPW